MVTVKTLGTLLAGSVLLLSPIVRDAALRWQLWHAPRQARLCRTRICWATSTQVPGGVHAHGGPAREWRPRFRPSSNVLMSVTTAIMAKPIDEECS